MKKLLFLLIFALAISCEAQHQYTLVFLNKKTDSDKIPEEQVKKIMDGHMANMERLSKEGKLLAAGPFQGGGGIFIFGTTSIDEARQWLSTDPGVQANRWSIEILPYKPRVGGVCPVGEQYEMTDYSFIRFNAIISKFTASTYPQIIKKHDDYLRKLIDTGNVVTEAIFGDYDGGILVMRGETQREIFESDPGVQEGLIELDIKKLFIAKGSFCEK